MEVYVVELELVTDEIDAVEEIEDYPTGEMLRWIFKPHIENMVNCL